MGDLAMVESLSSEEPKSEAWEAPVLVTPGADGSSQGTGGLLRDLVKRGTDIDVPGSAALSDAAPAPRVLRHHGSGGVWTAPVRLSRLSTPAY
jgi:hypothetical protein